MHARMLVRENMAIPMPACFENAKEYGEYVSLWERSVKGASICDACNDCTAKFRDRMIDAGRCDHPETTFARDREGEVVGVSATNPITWLRAISNQAGFTVTDPCNKYEREAMQSQIWASYSEIRKTTDFDPNEGAEGEPVVRKSGPKPITGGGMVSEEGGDRCPSLFGGEGDTRPARLEEPALEAR